MSDTKNTLTIHNGSKLRIDAIKDHMEKKIYREKITYEQALNLLFDMYDTLSSQQNEGNVEVVFGISTTQKKKIMDIFNLVE
jgi:hypothetical protein